MLLPSPPDPKNPKSPPRRLRPHKRKVSLTTDYPDPWTPEPKPAPYEIPPTMERDGMTHSRLSPHMHAAYRREAEEARARQAAENRGRGTGNEIPDTQPAEAHMHAAPRRGAEEANARQAAESWGWGTENVVPAIVPPMFLAGVAETQYVAESLPMEEYHRTFDTYGSLNRNGGPSGAVLEEASVVRPSASSTNAPTSAATIVGQNDTSSRDEQRGHYRVEEREEGEQNGQWQYVEEVD